MKGGGLGDGWRIAKKASGAAAAARAANRGASRGSVGRFALRWVVYKRKGPLSTGKRADRMHARLSCIGRRVFSPRPLCWVRFRAMAGHSVKVCHHAAETALLAALLLFFSFAHMCFHLIGKTRVYSRSPASAN